MSTLDEKLPRNKTVKTSSSTNITSTSSVSKTKQKDAQNKPQRLSLVNIKKESKQLDKFKEISLMDGRYIVNIRTKFLPSKIQQFIRDIQDALLVIKSENASMDDISNYFIVYNICILKNFSDIGIGHLKTSEKKDVKKLLDVAMKLLDMGILQEIISEFDEEEIKKLEETILEAETLDKQLGELMTTATINEQKRLEELGLEMVDEVDGK